MLLSNQKAVLLKQGEQTGTEIAKQIEYAGRTCWQSRNRITEDSYIKFIQNLIARGHETPLEFADLSFDVRTSRTVLAELTRHRLASFQVESQRYVLQNKQVGALGNEGGGLVVITPEWFNSEFDSDTPIGDKEAAFQSAVAYVEMKYEMLLEAGLKPEQAREVLPNCTACNIIIKANCREWRHFFSLRCAPNAYPPMRALAKIMLKQAHDYVPVVFDDLYDKFITTEAD